MKIKLNTLNNNFTYKKMATLKTSKIVEIFRYYLNQHIKNEKIYNKCGSNFSISNVKINNQKYLPTPQKLLVTSEKPLDIQVNDISKYYNIPEIYFIDVKSRWMQN